MPRKSKISPSLRKDWLNRHEKGERQDEIAKKDSVNPRTVAEQIERARLEISFEIAQREQLSEALRKHQDDMLELLKNLREGIDVPSLNIGFSFEDPTAAPEREITLSPSSGKKNIVTVIIRHGQPQEIHMAGEDSRLWRALKQHLGNKNSLWRDIAAWKRALQKEVQANAFLNDIIKEKIEKKFRLSVLVKYSGQPPHLTPAIIHLTHVEVTNRALGESSSDFPLRLETREGSLFDQRTSSYLAEWAPKPEEIKAGLVEIIRSLISSDEARNLAQCHRELAVHTKKTRDQLEDYLLLHHIPGRCDLCKKLGGQ